MTSSGASRLGQEAQRRSPSARALAQSALGVGLAIALLAWGLPFFAHVTWSQIWHELSTVPLSTGLGLLALMMCGLWMYTFTFTGSLPGLGHWQALIVNVAGSSVGNLLPAGGAVGLAATYTILRSWGFTRRAISTSAIVTGVWNVLARLTLPVAAIVALSAGAEDVPRVLTDAATAGTISGVVVLGVFTAMLVSGRAAEVVGRAMDRLLRPLTSRRERAMSVEQLVVDLRARILDVVQHGWLSMTYGMVGFFGIYFVLFWFMMDAVGVDVFFGQLFAAYAIGRLLTAVGITPGGVGITETATTAALVAWGADPAAAAAGTVLFTIYTHLFEVPLGALGWLAWILSPKREPGGLEDDLDPDGTPAPASGIAR